MTESERMGALSEMLRARRGLMWTSGSGAPYCEYCRNWSRVTGICKRTLDKTGARDFCSKGETR